MIVHSHHGGGLWLTEKRDTVSTTSRIDDIAADFPSMVLDSLDNPVVSYYDVANGDLKFARWDGAAWNRETVDAPGRVGLYTSIARITGGFAISYIDSTNTNLKYAEKHGAGPWDIVVVDGANRSARTTSLIASGTGTARAISYHDIVNHDLRVAKRPEGVAAWSTSVVDAGGSTGQFSSIIGDPSADHLGIAYYDVTFARLRYAWEEAGAWNIETPDPGPAVGIGASAVMYGTGVSDEIAISYFDITNKDLKVALKQGGGWSAFRVDSTGDKGGYTSMQATCNAGIGPDTLGIAFLDTRHGTLLYTILPIETQNEDLGLVWHLPGCAGPGGHVGFHLPMDQPIKVVLLDEHRKPIDTLFEGTREKGDNQIEWNGRDANGRRVPTGRYLVRLETPSGHAVVPVGLWR